MMRGCSNLSSYLEMSPDCLRRDSPPLPNESAASDIDRPPETGFEKQSGCDATATIKTADEIDQLALWET